MKQLLRPVGVWRGMIEGKYTCGGGVSAQGIAHDVGIVSHKWKSPLFRQKCHVCMGVSAEVLHLQSLGSI